MLEALEDVNWSGVITIVVAVVMAHYVLRPYQPIEVFTSIAVTLLLYPTLRLASPSFARQTE